MTQCKLALKTMALSTGQYCVKIALHEGIPIQHDVLLEQQFCLNVKPSSIFSLHRECQCSFEMPKDEKSTFLGR